MRYCRVTIYADGETMVEPFVPLFALAFTRWLCRKMGALMTCGSIKDSRKDGW